MVLLSAACRSAASLASQSTPLQIKGHREKKSTASTKMNTAFWLGSSARQCAMQASGRRLAASSGLSCSPSSSAGSPAAAWVPPSWHEEDSFSLQKETYARLQDPPSTCKWRKYSHGTRPRGSSAHLHYVSSRKGCTGLVQALAGPDNGTKEPIRPIDENANHIVLPRASLREVQAPIVMSRVKISHASPSESALRRHSCPLAIFVSQQCYDRGL